MACVNGLCATMTTTRDDEDKVNVMLPLTRFDVSATQTRLNHELIKPIYG